jgi:competence protein ComFC
VSFPGSPSRTTLLRAGADLVRLAELVLFPSFCRACGRLLEERGERVVCRACLERLTPGPPAYCLCCGRFFPGSVSPHLCRACLTSRPPYALHRSAAPYEGLLRELIILLKYRGCGVLARDLVRFLLGAVGEDECLWHGLEAIVPVPLHPRKKRKRGFNQSEAIAREIGRARGLPVLRRALRRVRNVPPQTSLEAEDRRRNVARAFAPGPRGPLRGLTVLLVDDVYTTGSTAGECCRVLRRAGAKEVRVVTLARS